MPSQATLRSMIHDREKIVALSAQRDELLAILTDLAAWDAKNPKGKIYPIGPNDCEKKLDAIAKARRRQITKGAT